MTSEDLSVRVEMISTYADDEDLTIGTLALWLGFKKRKALRRMYCVGSVTYPLGLRRCAHCKYYFQEDMTCLDSYMRKLMKVIK